MKRIDALFRLHRARSGLFTDYDPGEVAYIGNSVEDNAVVGYVKPRAQDRVFTFPAVVVSAFCEATVQTPPFVACGRAGNGLVVLEPIDAMSVAQLAYVAAYINTAVRWRFNWYRQVTADRLAGLLVPDVVPPVTFDVSAVLPEQRPQIPRATAVRTRAFQLDDLFSMVPGPYHALNGLSEGKVPVVSCSQSNNGIAGYFDVPGPYFRNQLTIAFNGSPLLCRYHPYQFSAKDDVAVCTPKKPLRPTTLWFMQIALNDERWRYSYYRKCYMDKLSRHQVYLPATEDGVDEDTIEHLVKSSPYWSYIEPILTGRIAVDWAWA